MKADQYSRYDSVKVKARADYRCEICGSDQAVQAHAPDGDHSDWRDGVCLCAGCHAGQHPNVPQSLFFTSAHQPFWPNVSARALAREFGCHSRTLVRLAKRLDVPSGVALSDNDRERIRKAILSKGQSENKKRVLRLETPLAHDVSTIQEVATALHVSDESVYRACRSGQLKAARIGWQWRISREAVDEFLRVSRVQLGLEES